MKPRMVFLRGGGLGDFILTLPLLKLAHLEQFPVTLYARPSYLELLGSEWDWLDVEDLDELSGNPPPYIRGCIAVSFWTDPGWYQELIHAGAIAVHQINPRPLSGSILSSSRLQTWSG